MKIIVTGGAGFIGSALCRFLINHTQHDVFNIDLLTYAANISSLNSIAHNERYHFFKADISDGIKMSEVIAGVKPDAVFNLAAESHVDRSIDGASDFIQTNIVGTYTLLEVIKDYWANLNREEQQRFRFVHISTDEVYGSLGRQGLFQESTAYDPSSPYSASKAASDHLVMAWHKTYGLPTLISNCSNNYGPFQFPEKLIPLMIIKGLSGQSLPVYGNGSHIRDWLYVDDHIRALYRIYQKGTVGETYNIGGLNEVSNLNVVKSICSILDDISPLQGGHENLIEFVQDRPGHDQRYAVDASKIKRDLDWQPEMSFEQGLIETVSWYVHNQSWWEPLLKETYSGERLGLEKGAHLNEEQQLKQSAS